MISNTGYLGQRTGDNITGNDAWTVAVHTRAGTQRRDRLKKVERTKELPWETEHQLLLGGTGLDEQDRYLSAIHVGDLEILAGADQ